MWQPIATAPKQGTNEVNGRVLLFAPETEWSGVPVIVTAYWDDSDCEDCLGWPAVAWDGTDEKMDEADLSDFTHWMPLPEPPVKLGKEPKMPEWLPPATIGRFGRYEIDENGTVWDVTRVKGTDLPRLVAFFEERGEAVLWARLAAEHGPKRRVVKRVPKRLPR